MWKSVAAKATHVAKSLSSFRSPFSNFVSSQSLSPSQNLRFLSNCSVNANQGEIKHNSPLDYSPNGDKMGAFDGETKKFEDLVSLLQQGVLESSLDSMNLDLNEELVLEVIESPLVPGKDLIGFLEWAIEKPGFSVTTRLVDALVRAVCSKLQKESVYALWNLVEEIGDNDNAVLNVDSLNHLIAAFSKLSKGKAAKEVFDKFGEFGCVPDSDTFYYTIEALCGRHFFDWASLVCSEMLEAKALPDSEKIGKIVWSLSKGNKARDARRLYLLAK